MPSVWLVIQILGCSVLCLLQVKSQFLNPGLVVINAIYYRGFYRIKKKYCAAIFCLFSVLFLILSHILIFNKTEIHTESKKVPQCL